MPDLQLLMDSVARDPHGPGWEALYREVCHRGACPPDSFVLLPWLAQVTAGFAAPDRDNAVIFAGQIAAVATDIEHELFAAELAMLRQLAGELLCQRTDAETFVYRLRALLALEGNEVWGRVLDRINDAQFAVPCPRCRTQVFVAFGEWGTFSTHHQYAHRGDALWLPLFPASPGELDGLGLRLYTAAVNAGQPGVATVLTYVFGRAACTRCGSTFRVADQVG